MVLNMSEQKKAPLQPPVQILSMYKKETKFVDIENSLIPVLILVSPKILTIKSLFKIQ